jgi:hypothetical protein
MARIGYTYQAGSPGPGQAQAFRNFLAANLTTWNVGPSYSFDSGTSERNYFTLTSNFNGEEILVIMPNGSTEDLDTSVDDNLAFSGDILTSTDQTLSFMLAIDGGFESRFLAGDDPNLDIGTFYPNRITRAVPVEFWIEGNPATRFYVIEDTENAAFFFYVTYEVASEGYSYWGYADNYNVFDLVQNDPTFNWLGNSVVQMTVTNSTDPTPRPTTNQYQWWHYTGQTERFIDQTIDLSTPGFISDNLTGLNQPDPDTGTFLSARTQAVLAQNDVNYQGLIGQLNPNIHRQFGTIDGAYRRKLVSPTGEVFVHLYFGQLTPWAGNLPNPI